MPADANNETEALHQHQIVFLTGSVGEEVANRVVSRLLLLDTEDPVTQIGLYSDNGP